MCLTALASLGVASCERGAPETSEPAATRRAADDATATPTADADTGAAERPGTEVADVYGETGTAVRDIAFWSHPTLAFNSLVIAAANDGLHALTVENGARVDGWPSAGGVSIAISYLGDGAAARGVALVAGDAGEVGVFEIDNAARTPTPAAIDGSPMSGARAVCLGPAFVDGAGAPSAALAGYVVAERGLIKIDIAAADGRLSAAVSDEAIDLIDDQPIVDCVVDPWSGALFTLAENGAVRRRIGGVSTRLFQTKSSARALDLALKRDDDKDIPTPTLVVLSDEAAVSLYAADGQLIGETQLTASFDYPGVRRAAALGVGSGNYGGVYRDGALALAAVDPEGDSPPVRMAPWSGVIDSLDAPHGGLADPRAQRPNEEAPNTSDISPPTDTQP